MTTISQYGITWHISGVYPTGAYVNGDYWVCSSSGIYITGIDPASVIISQRSGVSTNNVPNGTISYNTTINGSMINPWASITAPHGFDSAMTANIYVSGLNVARPNGLDLSISNPLFVSGNSSLISSISWAEAGHRPQLTDAAILTVVSNIPPTGAFRPPYCGYNKSHYWNTTGLNWSILKKLPIVSSSGNLPTLTGMERTMERPWIEIQTNVGGREMHPSNNQEDYGRDMTSHLGNILLSLHLSYTNEQKYNIYTRIVQYGLDVYGAALTSGEWRENGGHGQGRKMPMLLAGMTFNDTGILYYANAVNKLIFQDDQQVWYVNESDVGKAVDDQYLTIGRPRYTYSSGMIGLPEWGIEHTYEPINDASNWITASYRSTVFYSLIQHVLAAQLTTGAKSYWNWPQLFDYYDRVKKIGGQKWPQFTNDMWDNYRVSGHTGWQQPTPVPIISWNPVSGEYINYEFCANINLGAAGSAGLTLSGSSGVLTITGQPLLSNNTQLRFGLSRNIAVGETVFSSYIQPGNGIVASLDGANISGFSNLQNINYRDGTPVQPPTAPSNLEAYAVSNSQISIYWTNNGTDESMSIERSVDNINWVVIATITVDSLSYSDINLAYATTYYYRVRSYNGGGYSSYSNTASTTTDGSRFVNFLTRMGKKLRFPTYIKVIPESPYILQDDCEYPSATIASAAGWVNSNNPSWGYTASPAPLLGSFSVKVPSNSITTYKDFGPQPSIGCYFMLSIDKITGSPYIGNIQDINGFWAFTIRVLTTGAIRIYKKGFGGGATLATSSAGIFIPGNVYHMWVDATVGTNGSDGILSVYLSSTPTKPSTPTVTSSSGDWVDNFRYFGVYVGVTANLIMDKIRVARGPIGSDPE